MHKAGMISFPENANGASLLLVLWKLLFDLAALQNLKSCQQVVKASVATDLEREKVSSAVS